MKVLIRNKKSENWELVDTARYDKETELQSLLAESPELISIQEIGNEAEQLVVAIREFGLPVGYIDLLAFSPAGDIAIVECKLASNSEVKRKVIGQILEYGAFLWQMSYEDLDQGIRLRTGETLLELMENSVGSDDWDEEVFRSNIAENLNNGIFFLIIVVDTINEELTRILHYINSCGNPGFTFASLEMRRFQNIDTEMLIPRFFGPVHSAKSKSSKNVTKSWDQSRFLSVLQSRHGDKSTFVAKQILVWSENNTNVWWGKGKVKGSFVPYIHHEGIEHQLFAVWTNDVVEIYFQWYQYKLPFSSKEMRLKLLEKLNQLEGVDIPISAISKRPSISINTLGEGENLEKFLRVYCWVLEEIKRS